MATLDQTDLDNIGKVVKNNVRQALDTYEVGDGNPLHEMVEGIVKAELAAAFGADGAFYKGDGVYGRFVESTYEQTGKVLDERGFPKPEEPPKPKP